MCSCCPLIHPKSCTVHAILLLYWPPPVHCLSKTPPPPPRPAPEKTFKTRMKSRQSNLLEKTKKKRKKKVGRRKGSKTGRKKLIQSARKEGREGGGDVFFLSFYVLLLSAVDVTRKAYGTSVARVWLFRWRCCAGEGVKSGHIAIDRPMQARRGSRSAPKQIP